MTALLNIVQASKGTHSNLTIRVSMKHLRETITDESPRGIEHMLIPDTNLYQEIRQQIKSLTPMVTVSIVVGSASDKNADILSDAFNEAKNILQRFQETDDQWATELLELHLPD